jgi:antitoxin component YwqK of YwqJK toxin-antitoxin module
MYKRVFLGIISSILIVGCNSEKTIPVTTLECKNLTERDGVVYNSEDLFTGSCKTVFDFEGDYEFNGETNEIRTYKRGLRHGVWAKYYRNGQLEYKGNCKNGYIHGKYSGYYKNGKLKEEGQMNKGYRDGEWILYSDQGEPVKIELHKNRRLITSEYY